MTVIQDGGREPERASESGGVAKLPERPQLGRRCNRAGRPGSTKPGDAWSRIPIEKAIVQFSVPIKERQNSRFGIRFARERPVKNFMTSQPVILDSRLFTGNPESFDRTK